MKVPRDISGKELIKRLKKIGYAELRTKGSHVYLVSSVRTEHHIAIPLHDPLKLGTFSGIISDIAQHRNISKSELLDELFG